MAAREKLIGGALLIAAVAAVLAFLPGCGGGGEETSSSQPLTRAQFLKQAETICRSEEDRKTEALEEASKLGKNYLGGSHAELAQLVSKEILPLYGEMIEELAALSPPAKDKAQVGRMIDEYEARLKEAEATPTRQLKADALFYANKLAWKYGVKECTL